MQQTPSPSGYPQTSDSEDENDRPEAKSPGRNWRQIEQHTSLKPEPQEEAVKEDQKDTSSSHTAFEVPPPPPEVLSQEDLYALFSGAPIFSVLQKGNETPEPRVFFPFDGDDDEELEELSDCPPIAHPAFSMCTSRPHRALNPDARRRRARDDFELEEQGGFVEEEPSMLSFMGLEPGSCGWEYFMMYPVGDLANLEEQVDEDQDMIDEGGRERGRRGSMGNGKGGIRSVETDYIVERLKELGDIWNERKQTGGDGSSNIVINDLDHVGEPKGVLGRYSSLELYTQLFTRLLYPPTRITTEDFYDPYSLKVQIVALIQTLSLKKFWLNFKDVRWRIRLGQILWGSKAHDRSSGDDEEDEEDEEENPSRSEAEKVWLLLQILLATELAVRLDAFFNDTAIETATTNGPTESKEETCKRFKRIGTKKVEWDILLARRWLDNVRIIDDESPAGNDATFLSPPAPERRGWFSSRTTPPSPPPEKSEGDAAGNGRSYEALIYPRNLTSQFSGLMYFAKCLQWPQIEALSLHLQEKIRSPSSFSTPTHSVSGTPLATPLSMMSATANSYFQAIARPKRIQELSSATPSMIGNGATRSSALMKTMGSGGWMSRTYFSGLILPGEGLPHFLISTLLENDSNAVDNLGYNANLYSGFRYEGSTWWSSYCIIGKVLAGHGGSREVGGWIGPCLGSKTPIENGMVFEDAPDGWVDICTTQPEEEEARVLSPHQVKEESNPLGTKYRGSGGVLSSDLSMPKDDAISGEQVLVERLVLAEPQEGYTNAISEDFKKYEAEVHFRIGEREMLSVRLKHDIFFITSFPCLESHSSAMDLEDSKQKKDGHPLHKEFRYNTASVESVVRERADRQRNRILVIEAGGERRDREVLARAWCAERGIHAIIGGRGRTCLGCCIREARALGVWIVVRVE